MPRPMQTILFSEIKIWRIDGKYHKEDGPAIECQDVAYYYYNDLLHRTDGPAIIYKNQQRPDQWFVMGKRASHEVKENKFAFWRWI